MSTPSTMTKVGQNWEEEAERSTATSKVKAEEAAGRGGTHIVIQVRNPTSANEFFRVKRDVKMRRFMDMYCDKHSMRSTDVYFLDDAAGRIHPDKTPDEIGIEDGDGIYVFPHQTGS